MRKWSKVETHHGFPGNYQNKQFVSMQGTEYYQYRRSPNTFSLLYGDVTLHSDLLNLIFFTYKNQSCQFRSGARSGFAL